jgi:hypothetical protein
MKFKKHTITSSTLEVLDVFWWFYGKFLPSLVSFGGSTLWYIKKAKTIPWSSPSCIRMKIKLLRSLENPQGQTCCLPPPRTLIMDFTMTHIRFGWSNLHPIGQLTHTRRSDGAPQPDGALKAVVRVDILHYHQLYLNRPDQFFFSTDTHIYHDICVLFNYHFIYCSQTSKP